jgi:hypothetical protein
LRPQKWRDPTDELAERLRQQYDRGGSTAHRISLRSALASKQVRRDSDRNLDCLAVSGSVMLFRNTITQLIEN